LWASFLFVGGGYRQKVGQNSFAFVEILCDLINIDNSPYKERAKFVFKGFLT